MIAQTLHKIGFFNDEHIALFTQHLVLRNFGKGDALLSTGEVCQSIFLAASGSFIQFTVQDEIEQNIIDLHSEGDWCFNHRSFTLQKPSEASIHAFSDASAYQMTIHNLHALLAISPTFLHLGKILEIGVERLHFFDNRLTPVQKYQYILDHRPALLQHFPLKLIASYLKITPETLSRVREQISRAS